MGLEPTVFPIKLYPHGAGTGNRTPEPCLEGRGFTSKLHPRWLPSVTLPVKDSNLGFLVQSQVCCQLHKQALWSLSDGTRTRINQDHNLAL